MKNVFLFSTAIFCILTTTITVDAAQEKWSCSLNKQKSEKALAEMYKADPSLRTGVPNSDDRGTFLESELYHFELTLKDNKVIDGKFEASQSQPYYSHVDLEKTISNSVLGISAEEGTYIYLENKEGQQIFQIGSSYRDDYKYSFNLNKSEMQISLDYYELQDCRGSFSTFAIYDCSITN